MSSANIRSFLSTILPRDDFMTLLCEIRLSILSNEKSASVIWKYINLTKRSKKSTGRKNQRTSSLVFSV